MSEIEISQFDPKDIKELADLAASSFADAFGFAFSPAQLKDRLEKERSVKYFDKALKQDKIIVAKKDDRLVGYVQIGDVKIDGAKPGPKDKELRRIYIATDMQGQGIGKVLTNAALADPILANAPTIFLLVWEENKEAMRLYENYGFRVVGSQPFKFDDGAESHDLIMALDKTSL